MLRDSSEDEVLFELKTGYPLITFIASQLVMLGDWKEFNKILSTCAVF